MSYRMRSILGVNLAAYSRLRVKLGYTSYSKCRLARQFDRYAAASGLRDHHQLNVAFLNRWIHSLPSRCNATKNSQLCFARGFCDYLVRQRILKDNPARRLRTLKQLPYKPYVYSLHDIASILKAARTRPCDPGGFRGLTLYTLIFLLYACGLRIGETLTLKIKDLDFDDNIFSLWKTKFHKERMIPFSEATARKLKDYLAVRLRRFPPKDRDVATLFCHAGGGYEESCIEYHFRRIVASCGITPPPGTGVPRLHDLRRAFAIHRLYKWYQEGHDILNKLPLLSTYMGHVHIENTQIYLTITQALLREADRRFQKGFESITHRAVGRALPPGSGRRRLP